MTEFDLDVHIVAFPDPVVPQVASGDCTDNGCHTQPNCVQPS